MCARARAYVCVCIEREREREREMMCLGRQGAGAVVAKATPEMGRARVRAGAQYCCLCAFEWRTRTYQKFSKVSALVYVL